MNLPAPPLADGGQTKTKTREKKQPPAGIRAAAFDFDRTLVGVHTGGNWDGPAAGLARRFRPDFACYVAECRRRGIRVGVATFSTQKQLIADVLRIALPVRVDVPVFGGDDGAGDGFQDGKRGQLLLFTRHAFAPEGEDGEEEWRKRRSQTLLVDDDPRNVRVAQLDGYATLLYEPGVTSLFDAAVRLAAGEPASVAESAVAGS
jgi:hypothetical protein